MARSAALLAALAIGPAIGPAQPTPAVDTALPALPAAATTVEALVPAGWSIEQRHDADFNHDGRADVLLLLRLGTAKDTTPPRLLLVALATGRPRGYALSAANARLIPRDTSGTLEDPMADGQITVWSGGFELKLGMMAGAGSYLAATMRYRFRHENGCFRLVRYDRAVTHRGTLDTRDVSVSFVTRSVVETTGNAQSDGQQTLRKRLSANPRRCLPDLDSAWTFDPLS